MDKCPECGEAKNEKDRLCEDCFKNEIYFRDLENERKKVNKKIALIFI